MELEEMLKLNNTIVVRWVFEEIIESPFCTYFEREEDDKTYEGCICYRIDFKSTSIKVYL